MKIREKLREINIRKIFFEGAYFTSDGKLHFITQVICLTVIQRAWYATEWGWCWNVERGVRDVCVTDIPPHVTCRTGHVTASRATSTSRDPFHVIGPKAKSRTESTWPCCAPEIIRAHKPSPAIPRATCAYWDSCVSTKSHTLPSERKRGTAFVCTCFWTHPVCWITVRRFTVICS